MDSLTQLTLGAACGEAVLGRKVGNRAMLWGAIGGTIPDLDVLANLFTDEITALSFHRGITHSLLFAILAPLVFGWLVHRLYSRGLYRRRSYKVLMSILWLSVLMALINGTPLAMGNEWNWTLFLGSSAAMLGIGLLLWRFYWIREQTQVQADLRGWVLLFFWSIFTHPLLDSCTAYGTQLFQPFLDYRVALNNISVVDPIYTLPFLICLLIVLFLAREQRWRRRLTWLAIGLSSAYLLLTFYNKSVINHRFEATLAAKEIEYRRYQTNPTILNNVLWNGLAEGDSSYFYGMHSFYDPVDRFPEIAEIPKRHHLLADHWDDRDIAILRWFSNGYFTVMRDSSTGKLHFFDLRFGSLTGKADDASDFVFSFAIDTSGTDWTAHQTQESEPDEAMLQRFFDRLFAREE